MSSSERVFRAAYHRLFNFEDVIEISATYKGTFLARYFLVVEIPKRNLVKHSALLVL
jgi:hypothetical protein